MTSTAVSPPEAGQAIDLKKVRSGLVDGVFYKRTLQPDQQLRSDFDHYIASLPTMDDFSKSFIRETWFMNFTESYADMVCAYIRIWLDSTQCQETSADFLSIYLPGLPDFVFNHVNGGNCCLFYSLLCSNIVSMNSAGNLTNFALMKYVLSRTSSDALRTPSASNDTVLQAYYRVFICPIIGREDRSCAESESVSLNWWPEILSKSNTGHLYTLARSEFRKLPPMTFARFFSPVLSRLASASVEAQRFMTKQAVVELALFPFDEDDLPDLESEFDMYEDVHAWKFDFEELIRLLCCVQTRQSLCLSSQEVDDWLADHESLFPSIVEFANDDKLRSVCLRDLTRWLLCGNISLEDVLDHALVPGRFSFPYLPSYLLDNVDPPETLSENAKDCYRNMFARFQEHCVSKWPDFSEQVMYDTYYDAVSQLLQLYWKTCDIGSVFDSLTKTCDDSGSTRSRNLFDLAVYCMGRFTSELHNSFVQKFGTSAPLLALHHPLWSAKKDTVALHMAVQKMSPSNFDCRHRSQNIVTALLGHAGYRKHLSVWTRSDVRVCIGRALKLMSKSEYRHTYNKHPDSAASLDFCRKLLRIMVTGDYRLSGYSEHFSDRTQFIHNDCAVCLENMMPADITDPHAIAQYIRDRDLARVSCGHWFHQKCLMNAVRQFDRCPVCSSSFF